MRIAIFATLFALALIAAFTGSLHAALAIAAVKGPLVAFEFMELRHAYPIHLVAFTLALFVLALGLALAAVPSGTA